MYMIKKILVENFGYQKLSCYPIKGMHGLYMATFIAKKKQYYGIIDGYKILVPFSQNEFIDSFVNDDRSEYCVTVKDKEYKYISYHLSQEKNKYHLVAVINGNKKTTCRLVPTEKNEFWFIESKSDGITEYSLYDVKDKKILTPGFTDISFEEENGRVLAFVEKDLYVKDPDNDLIYLGALLTFIDYNGNFLAPLYMPENDLFYEALSYNFDKSFKSFQYTIQQIKIALYNEYKEKNELTNEHIGNMFNNLYTEEELKQKGPAKIIEYKKR